VARIGVKAGAAETGAAVCRDVDTEAMQVHIAPGKDDLQHVVEGGQRQIAMGEEVVPDQWAHALHNYTQLVNTGREVRGLHARSVSEDRRGFNLTPREISRSLRKQDTTRTAGVRLKGMVTVPLTALWCIYVDGAAAMSLGPWLAYVCPAAVMMLVVVTPAVRFRQGPSARL
jgi:hypothetical protein